MFEYITDPMTKITQRFVEDCVDKAHASKRVEELNKEAKFKRYGFNFHWKS